MPVKLERSTYHSANVHRGDHFEFWDSQVKGGCQNLDLKDGNGRKLLTIYGFTTEQLTALSQAVADAIRTAPEDPFEQS